MNYRFLGISPSKNLSFRADRVPPIHPGTRSLSRERSRVLLLQPAAHGASHGRTPIGGCPQAWSFPTHGSLTVADASGHKSPVLLSNILLDTPVEALDLRRYARNVSAKKPAPIVLFSDAALSETGHDAFELERKLGIVRDAILNKSTETPFTVMVTGGWGSGKTSAMSWLQKSLEEKSEEVQQQEEEDKEKGTPESEIERIYGRRLQADTCWFYPWKYQKQEDVWRGLIAEVILAAIDLENVDAAKVVKAAKQFGSFLGKGFVRILSSVKISAKGKAGDLDVGAELSLKEALGGVIEEYGKSVTPQEAYFNEFESVLKKWMADSYPKGGRQRLVVFIDDLDRCLPKIALQVLEALKLYLNIPNLVFVVGVDRTVIDQIVAKSYCDVVGDKAMEGSFKEKAAKYLDKMFQVEINIEPTDHEIRAFFERKIEKSDAWKSVPEEIKATLKILLTDNRGGISDRTPRTMVRQLNRLLVAGQRGFGDGSLTRAQAMQREMIDLICQERGLGDDLPQRSRIGREFFSRWSQIIKQNHKAIQNGQLASYLPPEEASSIAGLEGRAMPQKKPASDLSHLAPLRDAAFAKYASLLSFAPLARLLEISYEAITDGRAPEASFPDEVRVWIATKRGILPEHLPLTSEQVLALEELDISDLDISDLTPASCLHRLQRLDCDGTQASDLSPLTSLGRLTKLYCHRTRITDISPLAELTNLQRFSCSGTEVSDLSPLAKLTQIDSLFIWLSKVSDLTPLAGLKGLKQLYCFSTPVSGLSPLAELFALETLDCSATQVYDLAPLSRLTQLTALVLQRTQVSDLSPLSGLTSLEDLTLDNTVIADLSPLLNLKNLKVLSCTNTKVTKEEVAKLQEALPDCKISF